LVATTSYDVESGYDSDNEDKELHNLTNNELVGAVKDLAKRCVNKSRELCKLKKRFDLLEASNCLLDKEYDHLLIINDILEYGRSIDRGSEETNLKREYDIALEHQQDMRVIKALENHEPIFEEYLARSTGKIRLAMMIYNISKSHDKEVSCCEKC
jgi:hypothetical protein